MKQYLCLVLMICATAVALLLLCIPSIPLGVPDEWTWPRIETRDDAERIDVAWGLLTAALTAIGYCSIVIVIGRRFIRADESSTGTPGYRRWLTVLIVAGFTWLTVVQNCPPAHYRLLKPTWVLYDPGSSGYFLDSAMDTDDLTSFLGGYADRMAAGDVLHVGTHPPGLFVFHRGLLTLCRSSSGFTDVVLATQPAAIAEAFRTVESSAMLAPRRLSRPERAALWLATQLTQLLAVLTVIPLFRLVRLRHPLTTAWFVAACWPLVPGLAVFLPKSDALYPVIGMLFLDFWFSACRGSKSAAIIAGVIVWIGMTLSLALLPIVAIAGAVTTLANITLANITQTASIVGNRRSILIAAGLVGATFGVLCLAVFAAFDLNLLRVFLLNLQNHAGFYAQYPRTWWKWCLVNPLEFAVSSGVPVCVPALVAAIAAGYRIVRCPRQLNPLVIGTVGVWIVLHGSGKNMGEAARLWLLLSPLVLWIAPEASDSADGTRDVDKATAGEFFDRSAWMLALVLMAFTCLVTVSRVSGFHFL